MSPTPPVPETRLKQIATDACTSALASADGYNHANTLSWNSSIINSILKSLISETTPSGGNAAAQPPFKFAVNSTIIQNLGPTTRSSAEGGEGAGGEDAVQRAGRRGMHTAAGAYWNNERDGMWSFKYEGGEAKGMDVVISVMWIAI